MSSAASFRRLAVLAAASSGAVFLSPSFASSDRGGPVVESLRRSIVDPSASVPSRSVQESALIGASLSNPLDILVIGGGATGSGVDLDAATRGFRFGLVDREDFSSGTSKLIHGAVFNLDYGQLRLVFHALGSVKKLIENAPHLCHALPCMTPCFSWFKVVYFWIGLKVLYYSAKESTELFPTLARKGKDKTLRGTVVYYDGQMNDSRLNVGLACTAALAGAYVLNHAEVVSLIKDDLFQRVIGARIRNTLSVVNAAGPFCDTVRKMADEETKPMICPSSGVHIVLRGGEVMGSIHQGMGWIVHKTKDGRVVFMLPWLGRTVAGTTDSATSIKPHEDEIQFILDHRLS